MQRIFHLCKGYKTTNKLNRKIIYYHIPKCGGTTFSTIFSFLFPKHQRLFGSPTGERNTNTSYEFFLKNKKEIFKYNPDFIYGHFPYSVSKLFPDRFSIIILRDPVDRCISHYNFLVNRKLISQEESIEKCFKENLIPDNVITRMFSDNFNDKIYFDKNLFQTLVKIFTNEIDLIVDLKNIGLLYNEIITLYNLPNLLFENYQVSKFKFFKNNQENIEIIKKYNNCDIKIYDY